MCDIQKLAALLRENVDAICNGDSLLVLTVPVLQNLNESFVLINEHVPTSKENAVQAPADAIVQQRELEDLCFLLQLVRRAPGLRLVRGGRREQPRSAVVSVEHFHSLRHLVLHRVRLSDVAGLGALAPRLASILCDSDLQPLLAAAPAWPQLRSATFYRTGATAVPELLAAAAPALDVLDVGRNRLSDAAWGDFSAFRSLTRLGLAYNMFETVPSGLPSHLVAICLSCNYIDNIDGVSELRSLEELDLSGNCLAVHAGLSPLAQLPALCVLDLRGNPLAFHPRHRTLTAAAALHLDALNCDFVLDGKCLTHCECVAGLAARRQDHRDAWPDAAAVEERAQPSPIQAETPSPPEDAASTGSSTASDRTLVADSVATGMKQSTEGGDGGSSKPPPARKSRHVREAVITDLETVDAAEDEPLIRSIESINSLPTDGSAEHLETKRQVESLRQMFGHDNWLHSQGGSFLQGVLGLPPTAPTASALLGGTGLEPAGPSAADGAGSAPSCSGAADSAAAAEVDDVEVLKQGDQDALEDPCEHALLPYEGYELEEEAEEEQELIPPADDEEEEEWEQQLFAVRRLVVAPGRQPHQQHIFLAITDRELRERDTEAGRLLSRWQVDALESCELLSIDPARIRVTFSTVRPHRRERTYFVEDAADAQILLQTLRAILDARSLEANNLSVFRCMRCSSQFSEEVESPMVPDPRVGRTLHCPICGSAVVVQVEEEEAQPEPAGVAAADPPAAPPAEDPRLAESPSHSSIGSAASLDTSGEPSASAAPPGGGGGPRRCESDIEIISNPSQSSIEVLDATGARTPGRKRSSEERQPAPPQQPAAVAGLQLPPLLPTLPPPMTESSSSDSLTDSVCTAYEGRAPAPTPAPAPAAPPQTGPAPPPAEPAVVPTGAARRAATRPDSNPQPAAPGSDGLQYSYTDFGWADHRIKLHLYVSVFQQRDEELTTLVKGHVLCKNLTQPKPALVVLSTHKVYLLYITRQECDEPQRWLVLADSWLVRQLGEARVLPWGQGLSLQLAPPAPATVLLFLFDAERTAALLQHLTGLEVAGWCRVEREPPPQQVGAVQRLAATADQPAPAVRAAAFFLKAAVITDSGTVDMGPGTLAVGDSLLSLSTDSLAWLLPSTGRLPELAAAQSISNLVEVEVDGETVTPVFLDETSGAAREIRWVLQMGSAAVVAALLDAVRPPWEQLFSLPLQVSQPGHPR